MRHFKPLNLARSISGLSLVELMVAITLGLLLTAGILQLFNGSKITFNTNEASARVQENGRFALEILKRELRESNTHGWCAGRVDITNHLNACADFPNTSDTPLIGWEFASTGDGGSYTMPADLDPAGASAGSWSTASGGAFPSRLSDSIVPGTDFFVFRRLRPAGLLINSVQNNTSITLDSGQTVPGSIMMVTDCSNADLFQQSKSQSAASGIGKPNMNCSAEGPGNRPPGGSPWSTAYGPGAQAFIIEEVAYYVGYDAGREMPGLYRLNLATGVSEELVEGVENLQVRYGYSRDASEGGDGQSVRFEEDWLTANQVPNWRQVIAMRLSMSVRSDQIADGDRTALDFALAGATITTPGDGRLRQPFSATIALRNQVIVP